MKKTGRQRHKGIIQTWNGLCRGVVRSHWESLVTSRYTCFWQLQTDGFRQKSTEHDDCHAKDGCRVPLRDFFCRVSADTFGEWCHSYRCIFHIVIVSCIHYGMHDLYIIYMNMSSYSSLKKDRPSYSIFGCFNHTSSFNEQITVLDCYTPFLDVITCFHKIYISMVHISRPH